MSRVALENASATIWLVDPGCIPTRFPIINRSMGLCGGCTFLISSQHRSPVWQIPYVIANDVSQLYNVLILGGSGYKGMPTLQGSGTDLIEHVHAIKDSIKLLVIPDIAEITYCEDDISVVAHTLHRRRFIRGIRDVLPHDARLLIHQHQYEHPGQPEGRTGLPTTMMLESSTFFESRSKDQHSAKLTCLKSRFSTEVIGQSENYRMVSPYDFVED
jgi:hypothetical protein